MKYSQEFYQQLEQMIGTTDFHRCKQCGVVDGGKKVDRHGEVGKITYVVRLALIDPTKPANDIRNIGYYCTKCRRGKRETLKPPKAVKESWPRLF